MNTKSACLSTYYVSQTSGSYAFLLGYGVTHLKIIFKSYFY